MLESVVYTDTSEEKGVDAIDQRAVIEEERVYSKIERIGMMNIKEGAVPEAEDALYEVGRFRIKDVQYYQNLSDAGIDIDDPRSSREESYQPIDQESNDAIFINLKADMDLPIILIIMEIEAEKWAHPNITPFALSIFNENNI